MHVLGLAAYDVQTVFGSPLKSVATGGLIPHERAAGTYIEEWEALEAVFFV
jgi:hypothetical protein